MRKFVTLLIVAAAWYFAGMNRQPNVMAAAICGMIFIVLSFVYARVQKYYLSAYFPDQDNVIFKNHETPLYIHTENRSRLPVSRYRVKLHMQYRDDKTNTVKKLNGNAGRSKDNSNNNAMLYYTAPYSGMLRVSLLRLRVYDYFMIFSSSKKLKDISKDIAVLPVPKKMNINMPPFGTYTNEPVAQSASDKKGDDQSEIRLVREYRQGDLTRHMHRNYSARTEKIWIKEFQKENDYIFDLYIDSSYEGEHDITDTDAFIEVLSSVLHNLMEYDIIIKIHYYDSESADMRLFELEKKEDIDEFLVTFLRAEPLCTKESFSSVCHIRPTDSIMLIDFGLNWYFNGRQIWKFSKEKLIDDITGRYYELN